MTSVIETRDETYWENYYKTGVAPEEPSDFASYVMGNFVEPGQRLVELGCGNGRDARFFAAKGVAVLAVDQCVDEISKLAHGGGELQDLHFEAADFTEMPDSEGGYDIVYSRFTLHSVSAIGQRRTLEWAQRNLVPGGTLAIETRGQKNELYGKGQPVLGEPDAFIFDDHYRRFSAFGDFKTEVQDSGLTIVEASEETGYAPFEDTDYHFIRLIAQK